MRVDRRPIRNPSQHWVLTGARLQVCGEITAGWGSLVTGRLSEQSHLRVKSRSVGPDQTVETFDFWQRHATVEYQKPGAPGERCAPRWTAAPSQHRVDRGLCGLMLLVTARGRCRRPPKSTVFGAGKNQHGSELARAFFTSQGWSLQPCVRPLDAVHMTAGHNALRGSGPDRKPAFENAPGRVGCPDRRIDRLCITCCLPSQPSHHVGCPTRSVTPQARRVPCNARP